MQLQDSKAGNIMFLIYIFTGIHAQQNSRPHLSSSFQVYCTYCSELLTIIVHTRIVTAHYDLSDLTLFWRYAGFFGIHNILLPSSISRTSSMVGRSSLSYWVHKSPISMHFSISSWSSPYNNDGSNNSFILGPACRAPPSLRSKHEQMDVVWHTHTYVCMLVNKRRYN